MGKIQILPEFPEEAELHSHISLRIVNEDDSKILFIEEIGFADKRKKTIWSSKALMDAAHNYSYSVKPLSSRSFLFDTGFKDHNLVVYAFIKLRGGEKTYVKHRDFRCLSDY